MYISIRLISHCSICAQRMLVGPREFSRIKSMDNDGGYNCGRENFKRRNFNGVDVSTI